MNTNPNIPAVPSPGLLIVLSAPSGGGKTTLAHRLRGQFPEAQFSVSYTTRAPRGSEVYYVGPDGRLMSVGITKNPQGLTVEAELPVALFDAHLASGANIPPAVGTRAQYAVSQDGRFLVNRALDGAMPPIRVSLDWRSAQQK